MFRSLRLLAALLPAFLPLAGAHAAEAPVPAGRTFYASFEGTLDAVSARGSGRATPDGKPLFAPGHAGQGLVVGDVDRSAGALYEVAGNLALERGSLAMWVQPQNWRGDDGLYHPLFKATPGEKGSFLLYKNSSPSWGMAFYLDPDDGARNRIPCYQPIREWQPGEWHHLACTWTSYEGMTLYIDGKPAKTLKGVIFPRKPLKPLFAIGGDWQRKGCRTVLDDLMLFDRMLAPQEVALLAGQPATEPDPKAARDVPGVMLSHAILGHRALARVYRDCLGKPPAEEARLAVFTAGQDRPAAEKRVRLAQELTTLDVDLKPLPRGSYEARLTLLSGGAVRGLETLSLSQETADTWETAARIGREDTVLPPFTPLKVLPAGPISHSPIPPLSHHPTLPSPHTPTPPLSHTIACWGREYLFDTSGLPARIRSRDQEMLAAPVRIQAAGPEGALAFAPAGALKVEEQSPTQARLSGEMAAGALRVATQALARYDGTVWTTLRFRPEKPVRLERLRIEIPLTPAQARHYAYIAMGRVDEKRLGYDALPAGPGVVWQREFLPSLWLGTEERGVGWYAESDEHWDTDGEEALAVERRPDATVLCMNVIRRPREVTREFTIAFGLQATPVRPLAPDWRSYQWVSSEEITRFFLGLRARPYPRPDVEGKHPNGKVCYLYAYHPYFTNRLPKDPEEFREMVSRAKGHGLLCTPYTDTTFTPENDGDFWMREEEMRSLPGARGANYGPYCTADACHQGPFGDWFVWYVSHLAREYGSNGIYLDDMWTYGCSNAAHGCGYVGADGKRRLTYPLRARNETYRRLRAMFAATGQPFWMSYHISGGRVPPLPTFGDALLLAEERNPIVGKNPDYTANTTSEEWRASFAPEAWGIPVVVIPQFKMNGDWMKDPDLAAKFMAATVPHDLMAWPLFVHAETLLRTRAALEGFGIGRPETRFLPYWEQHPGLSVPTDGRVKVSAYLRPGKALLVLANWSGEATAPEVRLDARALGLPAGARARDAETGEALALQDGRLTVPVPAKRLRLVEVVSTP